mmetsp:Transcript_9745/g.24502  ORF Transcript_9745/g.24502 Transcript_9745/m.24502 type:complete len:126 (+) Transcript_9745:264-641(+)
MIESELCNASIFFTTIADSPDRYDAFREGVYPSEAGQNIPRVYKIFLLVGELSNILMPVVSIQPATSLRQRGTIIRVNSKMGSRLTVKLVLSHRAKRIASQRAKKIEDSVNHDVWQVPKDVIAAR